MTLGSVCIERTNLDARANMILVESDKLTRTNIYY